MFHKLICFASFLHSKHIGNMEVAIVRKIIMKVCFIKLFIITAEDEEFGMSEINSLSSAHCTVFG